MRLREPSNWWDEIAFQCKSSGKYAGHRLVESEVIALSQVEQLLKWELESRGRGTPRDELKRDRIVAHLRRLGNLNAESTVLSIACGTGYYDLITRAYVDELVCLDLSPDMLEICRRRQIGNLIRADSNFLPFRSETFDCVYALSLSTIGGQGADDNARISSISEMKRVAKSAAKIVVGHPTTLGKQIHGIITHGNPNFDMFRVSPKQVKNAYRESNLNISECFVLPLVPYAILRRIDYLRIDRRLSHLLLDQIGLYLFLCGTK
jgi:SAM-dependent methyltransferase